jgi:hypothetical protein
MVKVLVIDPAMTSVAEPQQLVRHWSNATLCLHDLAIGTGYDQLGRHRRLWRSSPQHRR